jgi:hypothetical protein
MAHRILRARAEVASGNAYADWVRAKSEVFRSEGITRLVAGIGIRRNKRIHFKPSILSSWARKINE